MMGLFLSFAFVTMVGLFIVLAIVVSEVLKPTLDETLPKVTDRYARGLKKRADKFFGLEEEA